MHMKEVSIAEYIRQSTKKSLNWSFLIRCPKL